MQSSACAPWISSSPRALTRPPPCLCRCLCRPQEEEEAEEEEEEPPKEEPKGKKAAAAKKRTPKSKD